MKQSKSEQIAEVVKFDIYEAKIGENFYLTQAEMVSNGYVSAILMKTLSAFKTMRQLTT